MNTRQRAVITQNVELIFGDVDKIAAMPNNEPTMKLEDGREVTAYDCDRFTVKGTEGTAEFDITRNIWKFTPDGA